MTSAAARAHAEIVLEANRQVNSGSMVNGQMAQHTQTASILVDICAQLEAVQAALTDAEWRQGGSPRDVSTPIPVLRKKAKA